MRDESIFWRTLRSLWRGGYGLPLDERVRVDAGLPIMGCISTLTTSPFVGAWLR